MKGKRTLLIHIGFWTLSIILDILSLLTFDDSREIKEYIFQNFFLYIFCAIVFYIYYLYFVKILYKKKILQFFIVYFSFLLIYTFLIQLIYEPIIFSFITKPKNFSYLRWYFFGLSYYFVYALWGTLFRSTIDWFKTKQLEKELEKQSVSRELALLRSQINPQFLFNTLGNINSHVFDDPDKTSFGIIKLSEIMRYMLYDACNEKVFLNEEISYIKNYIDLQKIKISNPDSIDFTIIGDTENMTIQPVLFTPFIENAFKYCNLNNNGYIKIKIVLEKNTLLFEIVNSVSEEIKYSKSEEKAGIKNMRRRLALLFGSNYELSINPEENEFHVKLKLNNF